jgi:hypothetical protein
MTNENPKKLVILGKLTNDFSHRTVELEQLVTCPVLVIIKQVNPSSSPASKC